MRRFVLLLLFVTCLGCGEPAANTNNSASETDLASSGTDTPSSAGTPSAANANVTNVRAVGGPHNWTFHVTVDHPDTGWKDYADGWDVVLPDGTVIKPDTGAPFTRLLLHPHEEERPFTRSQNGIVIPTEITSVTVRAHDMVDGFGGREVVVDLSSTEGKGFTVE